MGSLTIVRIYGYEPSDAVRILVDRLWPRGISKEKAHLNFWWKEIAPSADLRKWFGHDPDKYPVFRERYLAELDASDYAAECLSELRGLLKSQHVVLLYSAKDQEHNNAVVLKEWLDAKGV